VAAQKAAGERAILRGQGGHNRAVKQTIVGQKKARPNQKHKMVHLTRKRTHEAPTIVVGHDAYGYAEESRVRLQKPPRSGTLLNSL